MRSTRILLVGPAPSRMTPADSLEMLRPADLPKVTKCVLTNAKFDTEKAAKTFNIDANYAADPVRLQTLFAWSGLKDKSAEQIADGLEVFAIRAVIERDGPFGYVVLQRHAADLAERWPAIFEELGDQPYLDLRSGNILLNLRSRRSSAIVEILWELYLSGAVYGFSNYSFAAAVAAASEAMNIGA